jgi:predicted Zn finger-like uncharacterized protein
MLFTRCPECQTTFRVTDEALKKANGQVRCGRCATVFNAHAELHDPDAKAAEEATPQDAALAQAPEVPTRASQISAPPPAAPPAPPPAPTPPPTEPTATPPPRNVQANAVKAVVAEIAAGEREAASAPSEEPASDELGPRQVEEVLTTHPAPIAGLWPLPTPPERPRRSGWWAVGALLALLALLLQTVHHFRAELAAHPSFGPRVQAAYARLGLEVSPRWHVEDYEILDWIATAEPNSRGQGSLKITARIQNRATVSQPFPAVRVRLKDRWEASVGSRMFAPREYLPKDSPQGARMSPNATVRAEIEVVDPGPDAYGFELDVCVEVERGAVTCGADAVFR